MKDALKGDARSLSRGHDSISIWRHWVSLLPQRLRLRCRSRGAFVHDKTAAHRDTGLSSEVCLARVAQRFVTVSCLHTQNSTQESVKRASLSC